MQISPGMRISDVCMFCFEHTVDQPCPEYEAYLANQDIEYENCKGTECGSPSCVSCYPDDTCHCGHPDCGAC